MSASKHAKASAGARRQLRIIGGRWRGRRIEFVAQPGLRPTPDRVRETLFNWLQPWTEGSRCLDLFCGSGALGIEALSRGAQAATFVDASASALREIRANLARLDGAEATLVHADVFAWLRNAPSRPFDIVFLDPPFGHALTAESLDLLQRSGVLTAGARVYVESGTDDSPPLRPPGWTLHREQRAGQVAYRLYVAPTEEFVAGPADL